MKRNYRENDLEDNHSHSAILHWEYFCGTCCRWNSIRYIKSVWIGAWPGGCDALDMAIYFIYRRRICDREESNFSVENHAAGVLYRIGDNVQCSHYSGHCQASEKK